MIVSVFVTPGRADRDFFTGKLTRFPEFLRPCNTEMNKSNNVGLFFFCPAVNTQSAVDLSLTSVRQGRNANRTAAVLEVTSSANALRSVPPRGGQLPAAVTCK